MIVTADNAQAARLTKPRLGEFDRPPASTVQHRLDGVPLGCE
jgi:hypothetical protein